MNRKFTAKATATVHAPISKVWQSLVNPEIIKQYLFDTEVITDWQEGSPIVYKGIWQGKPFVDKGEILKIEPERLLMSTHWHRSQGFRIHPKIIIQSPIHSPRWATAPK